MEKSPAAPPSDDADFEDLFPARLHYVLEHSEGGGEGGGGGGGRPDVITWLPYGRAFLVKDRDAFVREYLPKYVGCCCGPGTLLSECRDLLSNLPR